MPPYAGSAAPNNVGAIKRNKAAANPHRIELSDDKPLRAHFRHGRHHEHDGQRDGSRVREKPHYTATRCPRSISQAPPPKK